MIAYNKVVGNKESSGVDGMDVSELKDYLKSHWSEVRQRILTGKYIPSLIKRVRIGKPEGGERLLGYRQY